MIVTPQIEAAACLRFKIPQWKWEEAKKRFPSLLPKVNQKRLRRIKYTLATGKLPPVGWTPPDPKNRSTQNVPPYRTVPEALNICAEVFWSIASGLRRSERARLSLSNEGQQSDRRSCSSLNFQWSSKEAKLINLLFCNLIHIDVLHQSDPRFC
jgi:hypothetical protein